MIGMTKTSFKLLIGTTFMALILVTSHTASINACSRVLWNNNGKAIVCGRTMDWEHQWNDYLFIFPRGLKVDGGAGKNSAQWTSKYGSVCCSIIPYAKQHGFGLNDGISDGMNEKGLAAHLLYLEKTQYPKRSKKPGVTFMRWVRYILDNCATVKEAVQAMKKIRIAPVKMGGKVFGTHVAVEDPSGDSAIFEFISGNLVIHHGKKYTVMTNDPPYPFHIENLKRFKDFGGKKELPGTTESEDRFVRLAHYLKRLKKPKDAADALARIYSVTRTACVPFDADDYGPTWWLSLSDCTNKVWYFNWTQNPNIVWVELKNINFAKGSGIRMANPRNPSLVGEISRSFEEASLKRIPTFYKSKKK